MFTNRPAIKVKPGPSQITDDSIDTSNMGSVSADVYHIRDRVQSKLLAETNGEVTTRHVPQMRQMIGTFFNQVLTEENLLYTRADRETLLNWVLADILGYGPLDPLLRDGNITEVMVNGPQNVYVERHGIIEKTEVTFENDAHLLRIIDRIVSPIGRRVDESSPMVDARLPSGYRVNATIPPLSLDGPLLTIRKFSQTPFTAQDLIANATLSPKLVAFIKACVEAKVNMVISGGTGSGKTTLLNVLSAFIPNNEIEGKGEVTIRRLVINSLRQRPDRIIVGEARGGEALDMLQAMNTGHEGSMTTIHSNSPRDTLRRIETMVLMAGTELTLRAIREQVASAIELVIHMSRLRDGSRKVIHVAEVQGMEGDSIVMQDIFKFEQTGFKDGRVLGALKPSGLRPAFTEKFIANSIDLPPEVFSRMTEL
jgi:pilus assembly protein CpaF